MTRQRREVIDVADWESVLSAAAHVQRIVPDAILVGGTAAAPHADHRYSADDDHVVRELRQRFDRVLADLETVAGWTTNRLNRPVQILGSLDGIDTGIRNLRRKEPLETTVVESPAGPIVMATLPEMLRVKAYLIATRNATRDYLDTIALSDKLGERAALKALIPLDELYPQPSVSVVQQLQKQLAQPRPYDRDLDLGIYKALHKPYTDWDYVEQRCRDLAVALLHQRHRGRDGIGPSL